MRPSDITVPAIESMGTSAMRYHATRPFMRRVQAIDHALRTNKWPTDKSLAADLEVDPRTIRHDLEFMRDEPAQDRVGRVRGGE